MSQLDHTFCKGLAVGHSVFSQGIEGAAKRAAKSLAVWAVPCVVVDLLRGTRCQQHRCFIVAEKEKPVLLSLVDLLTKGLPTGERGHCLIEWRWHRCE